MSLNCYQQRAVAWALFPVYLLWLLNGFYLNALARKGVPLFWLVDTLQWIGLPLILLTLLSRNAAVLPQHFGFSTHAVSWKRLPLQSLVAFVSMGLTFVVIRNISWRLLGYPKSMFSWGQVLTDGTLGTVVWIYSALTAGIVESIFFIGLPWLWFSSRRQEPSRLIFVGATASVFALAHWEQGAHIIVAAFATHIVACLCYFRFGSLWPVAAGHAAVDLCLFA